MTKAIKAELWIAALGVLFLLAPDLNVVESVLSYCGIQSHGLVRNIAIGLYVIVDLLVCYLFMKSKPNKREFIFVLLFNLVYIFPVVINRETLMTLQYAVLVFPVTILAVMLSKEDDIREQFFSILTCLSKVLVICALAYIIYLYIGTDRDEYGMVVIKNMTYGDMGYFFLPCFVAVMLDYILSKRILSLCCASIFALAVFYSGTRSAILCVVFAVFLSWAVSFIEGKGKSRAKSLIIITITIAVVVAVGTQFVPSGSRLNAVNIDFKSSSFSANDIIYENSVDANNDSVVIDKRTGTERDISQIYEEYIIANDLTKTETEQILHDDVRFKRYEYIGLINARSRELAENYTLYYHRGFLWKSAYQEFKKNPVFGNGPMYYREKYDGYYPHNIVLEVLADYGIVGTLIIVLICVYSVYNMYRCRKRENKSYYCFMVLFLAFIPEYLLYTTIYSNTSLSFTLILFATMGCFNDNKTNQALED